ncbi:unnamed protein product [Lathyrus sativus]|nr:unnamed protein product [Lathyrus sativus]
MDTSSIQEVKNLSGFEEGLLPLKYLGVPLTCKKLSLNHYLPLVDKILGRMKHWSAKLLSIAGVIHKINAMCRTFIWSGKFDKSRKSLVAWSKVYRSTIQGGLNMLNLEKWNKVILLKCLWNI